MNTGIWLLIVTVALGAGLYLWSAPNRAALQLYWQRSCTGRMWKRAFPSASKAEIRAFLRLFVDAFAFPPTRMLQFAPSDTVLAIYRALYPVKDWPDALEVETLAKYLHRTYRLELRDFWRDDLTLGEIFERARTRVA